MEAKEEATTSVIDEQRADRVDITFYTDPLCCWSWGMEPQWRRLQFEFTNKLSVRYVMGGLLPSWKTYNDPVFSVTRPQQMGPVWLEASTASGMPIQDKIWVHDPPASSYPACIAVKCAQLQLPQAGCRYLRLLREAVMIHAQNIARQDVLVAVAQTLITEFEGLFDLQKFEEDLVNGIGLEAFRADLNEVQSRGINRFPTLIIRAFNSKALMMTGYRPYPILLDAIKQILPGIQPHYNSPSMDEYKQYWRSVTQREIDEMGVASHYVHR